MADTETGKKKRQWVHALAPALSGVVAGLLAGFGAAHASGVNDERERTQEVRIQTLEAHAHTAFEAMIRMDERWKRIEIFLQEK